MKTEWNILLAESLGGVRTREAALRLLFLAWYSCSEPQYLSGLDEVAVPNGLVEELFGFISGEETQDTEALFVVAVMAEVAPWCLGNEHRWGRVAGHFRSPLGGAVPTPEVFDGRGAYGEYESVLRAVEVVLCRVRH